MILKGKVLVPGRKSPQIAKIIHLESLYTNINKHESLLGYNVLPFDSTDMDKLFLPDYKGISPQGILLFDAVFLLF